MALTTILSFLTCFLTLQSGVLGGLEHAKHSTKLDNTNFDVLTKQPEVGTLTAFFAPWCGHCKSLLGTWDIVAETFKTDPKCRVAHLDADQSSNRDIAGRYSVTGFPTIKFLFSDSSKSPLDYHDARSPEAFIKFLNKECGTHRATGGLLLPEAGRVATLDDLITSFFNAVEKDRSSLIEKATELAATANATSATYYVKVMNKVVADDSWLNKEVERLKKLAAKGATMAAEKFEELQIKQNILKAFSDAKESIKDGSKATKEKVEQVVDKVKGEL